MQTSGLNKHELTLRLNHEFKSCTEGIVLSINAEWGVGKTYFWKNYANEKLQETEIAYISLFGKKNIDEIKSEILLKLSKRKKNLSALKELTQKYKNALSSLDALTSGIAGVLGSALISALDSDFFENKFICFDDFERLSNGISHQEIMGLVSELKEEKKCKIILIMDSSNINDSDIFKLYKEKTIDLELFYSPLVRDVYDYVKDQLTYKRAEPLLLKYLEEKNIRNIRLIRHAIRALNDFDLDKNHLTYHKNFDSKMTNSVIMATVVYAKYHSYDYTDINTYIIKREATHIKVHLKNSSDQSTKFIKDEYIEELLYYLNYQEIDYNSIVFVIIKDYLRSNTIDTKQLEIISKEESTNSRYDELRSTVSDIIKSHKYDFSYSALDYTKDIYAVFKKDSEKLYNIFAVDIVIGNINELILTDPSNADRYSNLLISTSQAYLKSYIEMDAQNQHFRQGTFKVILNQVEGIHHDYKKLQEEYSKSQVTNKSELDELLKKYYSGNSSDHENQKLKNISISQYEELIITNASLVLLLIGIFENKNNNQTREIFDNAVKAFLSIKAKGNRDHNMKLAKILFENDLIHNQYKQSK
jgi:hypothetical protein